MAEERIARADRDATALAERRATIEVERDALGSELATAAEAESRARAALDELRAADAAGRSRLGEAERTASAARERLREADERLRAADHAELEARLGLESLKEQLLVELAGLGGLGMAELERVAGTPGGESSAAGAGEDEGDGDGGAGNDDDGDNGDGDESRALAAALDAVAPRWAAAPPDREPPSSARLGQLRRRYHELGAANPFAVEEYAEVRARLETLEAQQHDLRDAIARTRDLIEQLNRMIAEQFATTFRALEAAFDRRFGQLFGGGYAKLSLTDPGDLSATGVEIVARPPGKRAQPLAMLSGGERALTAVALLFAMLEVRPVPFCVLDEVDAALDEANVGRFSDALRSLADRTQFIVITHNRGTIEAADALYGVTVGDDSVSRVISLRLDEARAIAERHREAQPAGATAQS
jgi:chromosome segregation protein